MIDVDCFKFYNDSCGHQAGDRCLKRVADRLRAVVRRPADLVARYGGEEFAILLPDTGRESATAIANDSRTEVEALGISHPQSTASAVVTISVGVSTLIPTAELTPFVLVANADNALYRAKEFGRNKVASDLEQCTVRYRGEMV
jgi:diguanylate cyclase (GGDEF)-like protein